MRNLKLRINLRQGSEGIEVSGVHLDRQENDELNYSIDLKGYTYPHISDLLELGRLVGSSAVIEVEYDV